MMIKFVPIDGKYLIRTTFILNRFFKSNNDVENRNSFMLKCKWSL
jgi:hypothetical protein